MRDFIGTFCRLWKRGWNAAMPADNFFQHRIARADAAQHAVGGPYARDILVRRIANVVYGR